MIRTISAQETYPLRHRVLWPDKPLSFVALPDDQEATHFGYWSDSSLVSVGSLYPTGTGVRLRKFATLPDMQGQGIGTEMLRHMISHAFETGAARFWCDARLSATKFYERAGLQQTGPVFDKSGVTYRRMELCV